MAEYALSIKNGDGLVFKTKADSLEEAKYRGEIVDFLMRDQKINAIKVYKKYSNKTLRESKDYVDAIQKVMIQEGRLPKIN